MHFSRTLIACAFALTSAANLLAQTPIKSVDSSGNITYSDKAAADAASSSEVRIDTGPTQSQIDEAQKRSQETIDSANKAQAERDAVSADLEAERKKAAEARAAQKPEVIIIKEEGRYPVYNPPLGSRPPVGIPPGSGPEHPAYRPPAVRPPIARPSPR